MMIIDPVALGDVACTRASPAAYYDRNGAQQTAPANVLRVTYDPNDLTAPPYALLNAGEVIGSGAGLVYSNVPITETPYISSATYAQNAVVYDAATYLTYQSLIANNTGKALSDTTAWTPLKAVVNRELMFDAYNNTQTVNAEEIIIVVSTQQIAQGIFLGNVDASEVRVSYVDLYDGSVVYREVQSLVSSQSGSSFYNWGFKRIKRKSYMVTVMPPPYATPLVTIAIKKPGGIAKCGVCAIGPLVDIGLSQFGLSREIKDYSTTTFNFDGTSSTVVRGFAKLMDIDLIIGNDQIDTVVDQLESSFRQRPVVWIGAAAYGMACIFGTYQSFKAVIPYAVESTCNLQLQGSV